MAANRVGIKLPHQDLVVLFSCFAIFVALGGLVAYFSEELETGIGPYSTRSRNPSDPGPMMEMGPFTVSLAEGTPPRYLRATLIVEFDRQGSLNEAKKRQSAVQNAVTATLSAISYETARSYTGKAAMRAKLIDELNRTMPNPGVRAVYFRDLVME
jgi:flagellar basal body-associated protein FliL